MVIVNVRDGRENYMLTAEVTEGGDLVLAGSDLGATVKEMFHTDEYEYSYVVKAAEVPRVIAALGADATTLLTHVRALLEPHGISASTAWKQWLATHGLPFDFSVWR